MKTIWKRVPWASHKHVRDEEMQAVRFYLQSLPELVHGNRYACLPQQQCTPWMDPVLIYLTHASG
jgi:hypothetical protein